MQSSLHTMKKDTPDTIRTYTYSIAFLYVYHLVYRQMVMAGTSAIPRLQLLEVVVCALASHPARIYCF